MHEALAEVLRRDEPEIARRWAERIQKSSPRYRELPVGQIESHTAQLVRSFSEAITSGNFETMEAALCLISERRTKEGFELAEVQRALLVGCEAMLPSLQQAFDHDARNLVWSVTQIERVMHRAARVLHERFEQACERERQAAFEKLAAEGAALRDRLEAVLEALGYAAITVDLDMVVTWADARAASATFGLLSPGDSHTCLQGQPDEACPLRSAAASGEVHAAGSHPPCRVVMAIPLKPSPGGTREILALMK